MNSDRALGEGIDDATLARVSELLAERLGIDCPRGRRQELGRSLGAIATELGLPDARAAAHWLFAQPGDAYRLELLAANATVGETYFFRDPAAFDLLRTRIVPDFRAAAAGRPLRIWSAGCSSGEEPYSIAIVLREATPALQASEVSLLATDVNPRAIARAREGRYRTWSFRGCPPAVQARHFTRTEEGTHRVAPRVAELVHFACLNLVEDAYPSAANGTQSFDAIFCRNVLMYLRPDPARAVVERLARCLVPGGWLIVSPVETPLVAAPGLVPLRLPGAVMFRKAGGPAGAAAPPRVVAVAEEPAAAHAPPAAPARSGAGHAHRDGRSRKGHRPPPPPAQSIGTARELFARGRYGDAAAILEARVACDPADAESSALLVRSLANGGRLAEAIAWSGKALAADRLDPQRCFLHASILLESGDLDGAAAAYRRTLYLDPEHSVAHFALGNVLVRQRRRDEADRHYRAALAILARLPAEQPLAGGEGVTAGRLSALLRSLVEPSRVA